MKELFTLSDEVKSKLMKDPGNTLAIGRTVLANERTLLSFIRTGIGLLGGGIGLIAYIKHPAVVAVGWLSIGVSGVLLIWGIRRFLQVRAMMLELTSSDRMD